MRDQAGMTLSVAAQGSPIRSELHDGPVAPVRPAHRRKPWREPMLQKSPLIHSMTSGMPAANQGWLPIVALRIRRTGLSQPFEGAGERISSILKSPSAASGTALPTGVL